MKLEGGEQLSRLMARARWQFAPNTHGKVLGLPLQNLLTFIDIESSNSLLGPAGLLRLTRLGCRDGRSVSPIRVPSGPQTYVYAVLCTLSQNGRSALS